MSQFIDTCFAWPTWPSTILVLLVCGYWLLVIVGVATVDVLDFDLDLDFDTDLQGSLLDVGFIPIRFLNLGSVPIMLWVSIFSLASWLVARWMCSDQLHANFESAADVPAIAAYFAIGALLTKAITQPIRGKFDPVEPNLAADLIGKTCIITTSEATQTFGEAEFKTDAAPLILTVRATSEPLHKGDVAVIVDFTTETNTYLVERA